MNLKKNFISGFTLALLAFGGAEKTKAQTIDTTLTTPISLPEVVVEGNANLEHKIQAISSHRNLNADLLLRDIELNTPIPGLSIIPYRNFFFGGMFYRNNIPILIRDNLNYTLTSGFPNYHLILERGDATANNPALDVPLIMQTQIEEGIKTHFQETIR